MTALGGSHVDDALERALDELAGQPAYLHCAHCGDHHFKLKGWAKWAICNNCDKSTEITARYALELERGGVVLRLVDGG